MPDRTPPSSGWPRPFEGIRGQDRDGDLLSVETAAMSRRRAMTMMGLTLRDTTRAGRPVPKAQRISGRMKSPQQAGPGFEWSTARRQDSEIYGPGILAGRRRERRETGGEREKRTTGNSSLPGSDRATEDAWYIQAGPAREHACRRPAPHAPRCLPATRPRSRCRRASPAPTAESPPAAPASSPACPAAVSNWTCQDRRNDHGPR